MVTTPGASGMGHVWTEETRRPFSAFTSALRTRPDKDSLFKAGTWEHWASIPLTVNPHSGAHKASSFNQFQLHFAAQCNYLWRSTHTLLCILAFSFIVLWFRRESERVFAQRHMVSAAMWPSSFIQEAKRGTISVFQHMNQTETKTNRMS